MHPSATATCRPNCGACCTAPSITSPIPGMPAGKPAGLRCIQLGDDNRCLIFGHPERPAFCAGLQASEEMCGSSREHAILWLDELERATAPAARPIEPASIPPAALPIKSHQKT